MTTTTTDTARAIAEASARRLADTPTFALLPTARRIPPKHRKRNSRRRIIR